jgi:hypothetical protein
MQTDVNPLAGRTERFQVQTKDEAGAVSVRFVGSINACVNWMDALDEEYGGCGAYDVHSETSPGWVVDFKI